MITTIQKDFKEEIIDKSLDFFIVHYERPKTKHGKIQWTDENQGIALHKNQVDHVYFFKEIKSQSGMHLKICISKEDLKDIMEKIKEIEETEIPEAKFVD